MSDQKKTPLQPLSPKQLVNCYRNGATMMSLAARNHCTYATIRKQITSVIGSEEYRAISGHRGGRKRRTRTRKCAWCGAKIVRRPCLLYSKNVYCSKTCEGQHRSELLRKGKIVPCSFCGREIYKSPSDLRRPGLRFCSKSCAAKYYKREAGILPQREVTCEVCGKRFFRNESSLNGVEHHYCSTECAGVGKQDKIDVTCAVCGAAIQVVPSQYLDRIQHFCSQECQKKYMRMAVNRREDDALALCEKMEFYLRERRTDRPDQFWKIVRQLARRTELLVSRPQDLTEGTRQRIARVFGKIKQAQSEQERTDVWHLQH